MKTLKPMLAVNVEPDAVRFPVFASPKIDGVRGLVIAGRLYSRSLKSIPNPFVTGRFSDPKFNGYDGELVSGAPWAQDACRRTTGDVARETGEPDVKLYVFDNLFAKGGFDARYATLRKSEHVVLVEQRPIRNLKELVSYEEGALAQGYEGLILRSPDGLYKHGRSTVNEHGMLKLKRFVDSEATVLRVVEEMENTNKAKRNELGRTARSSAKAGLVPKGRMGAIDVRDRASGVEFTIGTGFNDLDRDWFFKHAKEIEGKMLVKYKSFPQGVKSAPRFPVYICGRAEWDL